MECSKFIQEHDKCCSNSDCRYHLNAEEDKNCLFISVEENGTQNLRQISSKLGISYVRVYQIEQAAMNKIASKNKDIEELIINE